MKEYRVPESHNNYHQSTFNNYKQKIIFLPLPSLAPLHASSPSHFQAVFIRYLLQRRYQIEMRGHVNSFKEQTNEKEQQIRESDNIMKKIGQIKESISPYLSNTKMSDGREKWYKYLPADNARLSNNYSQHSRDDRNPDNYRISLERRLEKLFKEEKQMLKERHYANSLNGSIQNREKRSQTNMNNVIVDKDLVNSSSIDHMERKIRQLEERYMKQQRRSRDEKREIIKSSKKAETEQIQIQVHSVSKTDQDRYNTSKDRDQMRSSYEKHERGDNITHTIEEWAEREKHLECQVEDIKLSVKKLRENNELILQRMHKKQEKRKNKQRTKEILLNILHKLEFMNVEISNAKRKQAKGTYDSGKVSKMQRQAEELLGEFQILRTQYRHLEQERKKVESRQSHIEEKFKKIAADKSQKI